MKKLIALLACLYLSAHLIGCTSKDSKEESESPLSESTQSVDGELEKVEGAEAKQATTGGDEGFLNESLPEDALGEKVADKKDPAAAPPPAELSLDSGTTPPPAAEAPVAQTTPPDGFNATPPAAEPPPLDANAGVSADTGTPIVAASTEAPKQGSTYKKVEAVPFKRGEVLLNAVYIARPKDSYKSVAKMIFGDDKKSKELKEVNPAMSSLRVGDKVYYNSPKRPTDDQKLLNYYEDEGLMPETYVAKEGDNLKKISKEVLGFDSAWKEVYATNAVESKGALTMGTELKYWKKPASVEMAPPVSAPVEVAQNTPPPTEMPPPPPVEAAVQPPPPPAEVPPPPPPPQPVAEQPPPPPPPPVEPPPPPPPPVPAEPPAKKPKQAEVKPEGGMDNDTLFALAGGGIALVGISAMVVIRKRKQQREMAAAFNDTQVGT